MPFDSEKYTMRKVQTGDRFKLKRLKGKSKRLSRLYIDSKVPLVLRKNARVLVEKSTDEIVWAEHLGISSKPNLNKFFLTNDDNLNK